MSRIKYCYELDDDGHRYIIPYEKKELFCKLLDEMADSNYEGESVDRFIKEFNGCRELSDSTYYFYLEEKC